MDRQNPVSVKGQLVFFNILNIVQLFGYKSQPKFYDSNLIGQIDNFRLVQFSSQICVQYFFKFEPSGELLYTKEMSQETTKNHGKCQFHGLMLYSDEQLTNNLQASDCIMNNNQRQQLETYFDDSELIQLESELKKLYTERNSLLSNQKSMKFELHGHNVFIEGFQKQGTVEITIIAQNSCGQILEIDNQFQEDSDKFSRQLQESIPVNIMEFGQNISEKSHESGSDSDLMPERERYSFSIVQPDRQFGQIEGNIDFNFVEALDNAIEDREEDQRKILLLEENASLKEEIELAVVQAFGLTSELTALKIAMAQKDYFQQSLEDQLQGVSEINLLIESMRKEELLKDRNIMELQQKVNELLEEIEQQGIKFNDFRSEQFSKEISQKQQKQQIQRILHQKDDQILSLQKYLQTKSQQLQQILENNQTYRDLIRQNKQFQKELILDRNKLDDEVEQLRNQLETSQLEKQSSLFAHDQARILEQKICDDQKQMSMLRVKVGNYQRLICGEMAEKLSCTTFGVSQFGGKLPETGNYMGFVQEESDTHKRWSENLYESKKTEEEDCEIQRSLLKNKSSETFECREGNSQSRYESPQIKMPESGQLLHRDGVRSVDELIELQEQLQKDRENAFNQILGKEDRSESQSSSGGKQTDVLDKVLRELEQLSKVNEFLNIKINFLALENDRLKGYAKSCKLIILQN